MSSSGKIRQLIGPAKQRLLDYLHDLGQPPIEPMEAITQNTTERAQMAALDALIVRITLEHNRITRTIAQLHEADNKWEALIARLDNVEATAEQMLYDDTALGKNNYLDIMELGREAIDLLEAKQKECENLRREIMIHSGGQVTGGWAALPQQQPPAPLQVHMPKLFIRQFSGQVKFWTSFWQSFDAAVHSKSIDNILKMTYLFSYLTGEAFELVRGYDVTADNYQLAVDALKNRYGSDRNLKDGLYAELSKLPESSDRTADLRSTYVSILRITKQLEQMHEAIDNAPTINLIETKFSYNILMKLYESRTDNDKMTVAQLLTELDKLISLRERVSKVVENKPKSMTESRPVNNRNFATKKISKSFVSEENSTFLATSNQSQPVNKKPVFNTRNPTNCYFCKGQHPFYECRKYPSTADKRNRANELSLCYKCLRPGHGATTCPSHFYCYHCRSQMHTSVLCREQKPAGFNRQQVSSSSNESPSAPMTMEKKPTEKEDKPAKATKVWTKSKTNNSAGHAAVDVTTDEADEPEASLTVVNKQKQPNEKSQVLLLSTNVVVSNPNNEKKTAKVMAFFDPGSHHSYVVQDLVDKLDLPIDENTRQDISVSTFGDGVRQFTSAKTRLRIRLNDGSSKEIALNTVKNITQPFRIVHLTDEEMDRCQEENAPILKVEDMKGRPYILLGSNLYYQFVLFHDIQLASGFHIVQSTVGPMLGGQGRISSSATPVIEISSMVNNSETDLGICSMSILDDTMEKLCGLENIGIVDCPKTKDDDLAVEQFQKCIKKVDGHYQVKWPLKTMNPDLPTNYGLALGRLHNTLKKLRNHPDKDLLHKYHAIMQDQLAKGIIEKVPNKRPDSLVHYVAHQAVITPQKDTTKLRVVFDASAKSGQSKNSLNDVLLRGPVILPELGGMLIRFRLPYIAITADIEKAFLNISLDLPDRDLTRFFWVLDPTKDVSLDNLVVYRFCRVTFGVISSPFLLGATILHHLSQYDSTLAKEIAANIYVDNCILSANTTEEAIAKYHSAKEIFHDAAMNLREFVSNDAKFNASVEQIERHPVPKHVKVLGIAWTVDNDQLKIALPSFQSSKKSVTKRQVLQFFASVFDPLGLVAPVIVQTKIIFQRLWLKKYDWDKALSTEDEHEWRKVVDTWNNQVFTFRRRLFDNYFESSVFELHCFTDASNLAYAAVVFIKQIQHDGNGSVSLLISKNRLNPMTPVTIPRLELLGVVIGVRLLKYVIRESRLTFKAVHLWTDSACTLKWISTSKPQPRFVENRLKEIRSFHPCEFHHVAGEENPADISSRGMNPQELLSKDIWWTGPSWLKLSDEHWPEKTDLAKFVISSDTEWPLVRNVASFHEISLASHTQDVPIKNPMFHAERFSQWLKLLGAMAWVLRFVKKFVLSKLHHIPQSLKKFSQVSISGSLTAIDYQLAETIVLYEAQAQFPPTVQQIQLLHLHREESGLLKCRTRIENSDVTNSTTSPIFLPCQSRVTRLLILHIHRKNFHSGVSQTLSELRQKYWLPQGRATVQKILRRECMGCRRFQVRPFQLPEMPQLPTSRVTRSRAFEHVGVDYLGPIHIKLGNEKVKAWVSLFTCFSTRAVHLEIVLEANSEAFLNALRRFIGRCGQPTEMLSDNAGQFVLVADTFKAAMTETSKKESQKVLQYCAQEQITWKFTTERSPWKGGLYERLVGVFKQSFRKAVGRRCLTFDKLQCLVVEIEAVMNSRPLTYVGEGIKDIKVLRPIDFLRPYSFIGAPQFENDDDDPAYQPSPLTSREKLLKMWSSTLSLLDQYWQVYYPGYLLSLREKHRFQHPSPRGQAETPPREGTVVIVEDQEAQRGHWKIARVWKLSNSEDGTIRSATIEMPNGQKMKRAINALYPLEVEDSIDHKQKKTVTMPTGPMYQQCNYKFYVLIIICWCGLLGVATGSKCTEKDALYPVLSQSCVHQGIVVMADITDKMCYIHVNCVNDHVQPIVSEENRTMKIYGINDTSTFCGTVCGCPNWTNTCSHYNGPRINESTIERAEVRALLEQEAPEVCSFKADDECKVRPSIGNFDQIELFDNSIHLVRSLQLRETQMDTEDYTCIGNGTQISGSSKYCENHECKETPTDKFCFYLRSELVQFVSDEGMVPIQSWGTVRKVYYKKKSTIDSCPKCDFRCTQGGIWIMTEQGVDKVEACAKHHCHILSNPKQKEILLFPHETAIFSHRVSVKAWKQGNLVKVTEILCPANPICDLIQCYWCLEFFANSQCAPKAILLVIFVGFYLLLTIAYILLKSCAGVCNVFYFLIWFMCRMTYLVKSLLRILCRFIYCHRWQVKQEFHDNNDDSDNNRLNSKRSRFRYLPNLRRKAMLTSLAVLCLWTQICNSCTDTMIMQAASHHCISLKDSSQICTFSETTSLSIIPGGDGTCLVMRDEHGKALGNVKVEVVDVSTVCRSKIETYSRFCDFKVESIQRCPGAGSCPTRNLGNPCGNVTRESWLNDLSETANTSPGYSYCIPGCGEGIACGCFWLKPACLYYRVFARAKSTKIYKKFGCSSWTLEMQIRITVETGNDTVIHMIKLHPGLINRWNHIRIVATSVTVPPIPFLNSKWITSENRTILLDEQQDQIPWLRCQTQQNAELFNCKFSPDTCDCNVVQDKIHCACKNVDFNRFNEQQILPIKTSGILLTYENGQINARYENNAAIQLQLTFDKMKISSESDYNECNVAVKEFGGCYSCITGAVLKFHCSTSFGQGTAFIRCGKNEFTAKCDLNGHLAVNSLVFSNAAINENCSVTCPAGTTYFIINGTLAFIGNEEDMNGQAAETIDRQVKSDGWTWPNLSLPFLDLFNGILIYNWISRILFVIGLILTIILSLYLYPHIAFLFRIKRITNTPYYHRKSI